MDLDPPVDWGRTTILRTTEFIQIQHWGKTDHSEEREYFWNGEHPHREYDFTQAPIFFLFLQFIARCITAERKTNFPPVISDECETNGRDTARRHRLVSGNWSVHRVIFIIYTLAGGKLISDFTRPSPVGRSLSLARGGIVRRWTS